MKTIKLSLDSHEFWNKPTAENVKLLSNCISRSVKECKPVLSELKSLAFKVGRDGCTFCPATFNGKRSKDTFEQQQLFALDFDNKSPDQSITVQEVLSRARYYELPVLFIYDTFSSVKHNKFRVVFLANTSISHRKIVEAILLALGTIFPEADSSCYRDCSKLYFGGKELLYFNDKIEPFTIESVFRNLTQFFKNRYGLKHYKDKLAKFSAETGIALTAKGFLDISVVDNPTETAGASLNPRDGGKSPDTSVYIIGNGEIFPYDSFAVRLVDGTGKPSVAEAGSKTAKANTSKKNHKPYRANTLTELHKCQLYEDFYHGNRDLSHNELFGLATSMIQIENGPKSFDEIQALHPRYYDNERRQKWNNNLRSFLDHEYKPMKCSKFCPYCEKCQHKSNILTTVCPKRGTIEPLLDYQTTYYSLEEVQEDTYHAIHNAYFSNEKRIHVIKAMTSVGKTTSYLRLMSENPFDHFLIAAPTNLLKNEIYERALKMNLNVKMTPSLEEIKDGLPKKVWRQIQRFYASGQHHLIHPYLHNLLKKENIPCLEKYLKEREELRNFHGCVITTHKYLLTMDKKRLNEFDAIIVDEDILFKSVVSNQCEISLSDLRKLLKAPIDNLVKHKIQKLLHRSQNKLCIKLDSFEWTDNSDKLRQIPVDIPAFCAATHFYIRNKVNERNLSEDTVVFIKPATFFDDIKYIIVSATADHSIYSKFFGANQVSFYECKQARYLGNLFQYPQISMSRTSLESHPGLIRRLMRHFNLDERHVITFLKEKIGFLHFGNTEGSNSLEGEDILVVGTPYHADFLYKLIAFTMGLEFDEDSEATQMPVEHNGYQFWFTTFKNSELQAVQFWMIESELEQAVGRARLLRNSCNVYLFSNFILSQALIIKDFDYSV